jgi:hypothetical protein
MNGYGLFPELNLKLWSNVTYLAPTLYDVDFLSAIIEKYSELPKIFMGNSDICFDFISKY